MTLLQKRFYPLHGTTPGEPTKFSEGDPLFVVGYAQIISRHLPGGKPATVSEGTSNYTVSVEARIEASCRGLAGHPWHHKHGYQD